MDQKPHRGKILVPGCQVLDSKSVFTLRERTDGRSKMLHAYPGASSFLFSPLLKAVTISEL